MDVLTGAWEGVIVAPALRHLQEQGRPAEGQLVARSRAASCVKPMYLKMV